MPENRDLNHLRGIWTNSHTQIELDIGLENCGLSIDELHSIALENKWKTGPIALANIASTRFSEEATPEFVDAANKATVRELQEMLAIAIAKIKVMMEDPETPIGVILDQLDSATKTFEKQVRIERPMHGLSTTEPPGVGNPINIFLDSEAVVDDNPGEAGETQGEVDER